jgi:alpha-L-arabinofuranosidase
LYRDHFGDRLLTVTPRNVPTYVSNGPIWWDGYAGVAPYLRSYASLAEGGQSLRIIVVSRQQAAASTVTFALQGFDPVSTANVWELAGDSLMATNENVGGPVDAVRIVQKTAAVSGSVFIYVVPPHSVSAIELRRR